MLSIFSIFCMTYIMVGFLIYRAWLNDDSSEELNKCPVIVRIIAIIVVLLVSPVLYLKVIFGGKKK